MTPGRAWKPCTGTRGGKKGLFQTTHTTHRTNFKPSEPDFLWRGHPLRTAGRGALGGTPLARARRPRHARTRAAVGTRARMHATGGTRTGATAGTHPWRRARGRKDARTVPLGARNGVVPVGLKRPPGWSAGETHSRCGGARIPFPARIPAVGDGFGAIPGIFSCFFIVN